MKYKTIGAFKNVQNVPYCRAAADMKVGMGVIIDRVNKTATAPSSDAEAKTCFYIVTNINDKPEMHSYQEAAQVLKGEFVRADDLITVNNMEIEFADFEINTTYADIDVGDFLVFGDDGVVEVADDATGYAVSFEVIKKTGYMGKGILAVIHSLPQSVETAESDDTENNPVG